jgi:hypothetical protein
VRVIVEWRRQWKEQREEVDLMPLICSSARCMCCFRLLHVSAKFGISKEDIMRIVR